MAESQFWFKYQVMHACHALCRLFHGYRVLTRASQELANEIKQIVNGPTNDQAAKKQMLASSCCCCCCRFSHFIGPRAIYTHTRMHTCIYIYKVYICLLINRQRYMYLGVSLSKDTAKGPQSPTRQPKYIFMLGACQLLQSSANSVYPRLPLN